MSIASLDFTHFILEILFKYWWAFLIILAFKIIRLPKVKGWFGEKVVDRGLKKLPPKEYHVFHDFYLPRPDGKGTTQIDHLVLSQFGIFVIETKNYKGWIFGTEKQKNWTQQIYRKKSKFQNPLHQNKLHINALKQFLNLDSDVFHNCIFFIGDCTLKTPLPDNVMTKDLLPFIKKHRDHILTEEEVERTNDLISQHIDSYDKRKIAKQHLSSLRARA